MPGNARRGELTDFPEMADILTEVSQAELGVILLLAGAEPLGKVIEIAGVGEQGIGGQSPLGFEILPKSGDIVVKGLQGHDAGSRENVCYLGRRQVDGRSLIDIGAKLDIGQVRRR